MCKFARFFLLFLNASLFAAAQEEFDVDREMSQRRAEEHLLAQHAQGIARQIDPEATTDIVLVENKEQADRLAQQIILTNADERQDDHLYEDQPRENCCTRFLKLFKGNCCKKTATYISPKAIVKAITYRITGTTMNMIVVYIVTRSAKAALTIGGVNTVLTLIGYYVHERAWEECLKRKCCCFREKKQEQEEKQ